MSGGIHLIAMLPQPRITYPERGMPPSKAHARSTPMKDQTNPDRRRFFAEMAAIGPALMCSLVFAKTASASQKKTYKYRWPKCKLIQEYGTMGSKKCPSDGTTMIRMN